MARPLRIELAGGLYHVTSRGDRREDIYLTDDDRRMWLEIFADTCRRHRWLCHAYCLMNNHYHIVVETIEGNLAKGMRQLNGVYTQRFNRKYDRVGHVFQGRYKSIVVDRDSYLLSLLRYVVLNPVRAGMIRDIRNWPWSSYPAMIGDAEPAAWMAADEILALFSRKRHAAIHAYIDFIRAGIGQPDIWENLKDQIYLGDENFIERMKESISGGIQFDEIPKPQIKPAAQPLGEYSAEYADPKQAMALAYQSGRYTMKEIARHFGVHYSTVSRAVKAMENQEIKKIQ
ncbi:MAG: transposase [Gammaproteobacteria bacterium]